MFSEEMEVEALRAAERYGWDNEAMTGNIYPLIKQIVRGELDLSEAKKRFVTIDWRLAKRQLTWFRRNEHIKWLSLDEAYTYIAQQLVDLSKS
jgi:tRNA A37 N6-isopentenylltransferase MiaA